jgi:hypothetical protein
VTPTTAAPVVPALFPSGSRAIGSATFDLPK